MVGSAIADHVIQQCPDGVDSLPGQEFTTHIHAGQEFHVSPTFDNTLHYIDCPMNYQDAQNYCATTYNGNLATIADDQDKSDVNAQITFPGQQTWMGLYSFRESGWFTFQNGDQCTSSKPAWCVDFWGTTNRYGYNAPLCLDQEGSHPCVYYSADTGLVYNDLSCTEERPFICRGAAINLPHPELKSFGICPCQSQTVSTCDEADNNAIEITCVEPDYWFNVDVNDAIRSCIDINDEMISSCSGITVEKVVVKNVAYEHAWVGDTQGWLQRGDGLNRARLFGEDILPAGIACGESHADITLDDDATLGPQIGTCGDGEPGYDSVRQPIDSLSVFDGDSPNGRWELYIYDYDVSGDHPASFEGQFGEWTLRLELSRCPTEKETSVLLGNN